MKFSASFRLPSSVSLRPLSQPPTAVAPEHPTVVALRRKLIACALERPPRFRTDLDVLVLVQFLAGFEAFAGVALPALHYLATEATLLEDPVTEDSCAFVIMDGSLCGYFNRAFSQRPNVQESFQVWNARQAKLHGVLIDFGEFQTTYSSGAQHAQEQTRAIAIRMDTLERIRHRFSLTLEKGALWAKDASQSDLAYLGICAQLSEPAKIKLLQTAPRRRLVAGEDISPPYSAALSSSSAQAINAFVIVLSGCLDVFWDGDDDDDSSIIESLELTLPTYEDTALAKIWRGQTFGDQTLGLTLDKMYPEARLASTSLPVRLVSGDAGAELIWVSKELYEETLREDRVRLSYNPISSASSASLFVDDFRDWALPFFASKSACERTPSDLSALSRRLLADATLSKFLFQFPPLVLERVCHAMELRHFSANALFLGSGDEIVHASIVVHGALRVRVSTPPSSVVNTARLVRTSSVCAGSTPSTAAPSSTKQEEQTEQLLPGDVFGAAELAENAVVSSRVVYVEADTLLLTVPSAVFRRWLAPLVVDTIFSAGTAFHRLATSDPATAARTLGPSERRSKPTGSPTSRQSVVPPEHEPTAFSAPAFEGAAALLKRMGLFPLVPRFLLHEMLAHVSVVRKDAGDVLFHEGEESQLLVVLLAGFLSFYSLEHMSTTLEMFQKHTFCHFNSFHGSETNPEDFVVDETVADAASDNECASRSAAIAKHRAAMHGVHIQTLHARNAFRTGVLAGGTLCPATVVAQTNCECLVLDESAYVQLLRTHSRVLDVDEIEAYPVESGHDAVDAASALDGRDPDSDHELFPPGSLRSIISQRNPLTLHPVLVRCFEQMHIPWLTQSPLKMQQLLRSMRSVHVKPGERLIRCHDVLDHLIIVLSGRLVLFVRRNEDVATFLDASQRSVRSLMLERSVASNYSTTSQQLYKE
ncbi:hypothetical protein PybrP1_005295, partial [[Pythium] brassicae (nom. inval.)]